MSQWPSTRARLVLAALLRIGWVVKRQTGSHKVLSRPGWPDLIFAFHDRDEIGPRMLARIAKHSAQPHTKAGHYVRKLMAGTRRAQTLRRRQSPCRIRRYSRRSAPRTACSSDRSLDGTSTNVNAKTG